MCHPIDQRHLITHRQCTQPCRRIPSKCPMNHPCTKLCNEDCGRCLEIVEDTIIPCGHIAKNPTCDSVRDDESLLVLAKQCRQKVLHNFSPCGHKFETHCGNANAVNPICPGLCGEILECGHPCQNRWVLVHVCYNCVVHTLCLLNYQTSTAYLPTAVRHAKMGNIHASVNARGLCSVAINVAVIVMVL